MDHVSHALLDLRAGPVEGVWSLVAEPHLCRVDGRFYGGAALATAIAAGQQQTGRSMLWCTTQIAGSAALGETIEVRARSLARGRTIDQFLVSAFVGEDVVFQAVGAAGASARQGMNGQWGAMPRVDPPEACEPLADRIPASMGSDVGHQLACEQRFTRLDHGRSATWARLTGRFASERWSTSPAALAFVADLVPLAISEAAGVFGAGASLDNTLRIGETAACDWVLIELGAQMAVDGIGHGDLRIWSPDGRLLAVGGQTARMFTAEDFVARFER